MSRRLFALLNGIALVLSASAPAAAADRGPDPQTPDRGGPLPDHEGLLPVFLYVEAIPGLTLEPHLAPREITVPKGASVRFRQLLPDHGVLDWSGATEVTANLSESIAEFNTASLGQFVVATDIHQGTRQWNNRCVVNVLDVPVDEIRVIEVSPWVWPFDLTENASNADTMWWYSLESIAPLQRMRELPRDTRSMERPGKHAGPVERYRTSTRRSIGLGIKTKPTGFESLMEIHVPDVGPRILSELSSQLQFSSAGTWSIAVGPPMRSKELEFEIYQVTILGHDGPTQLIPEDIPVTFQAVTDPPGYEDEITWLSSTKYGTAKPVLGHGATFTTQFNDTFGEGEDGNPFQWLGVRADNAVLGQDQKCPPDCPTGACCLVGSCQVGVTQANCAAQSGTYRGDGSSCPPTGGTTGACCFRMVGCAQRTPENCSCQGGFYLGNGAACPANDPDTDCIGNATDNCDNKYNPLQVDLDLDGVGDECDNCPTVNNPGQENANGDMGGDACEPPSQFAHCDTVFTPAPGVAPELLDPGYPHPNLNDVVHPVVQLGSALMGVQSDELEMAGAQVQGAIAYNLLLVSVQQADLNDVAALPFVRAIFPLPLDCRIGPGVDDGLEHDVHVIFHDDVPTNVANSILVGEGATNILPGGTIQGSRTFNIWRAHLSAAAIVSLAAEEPVVHITLAPVPEGLNDGSRAAIGANVVQAAPFCAPAMGCFGGGIVLSEVDTGWVAGDVTGPALPAGGAHAALTGSVTVRDRPPLAPLAGPGGPVGCAGAITCSNCFYTDHATHVSGTIMGDGGAGMPAFQGMSPAATNISYNWHLSALELACELTDANVNFGARAVNNSWGYPPPATLAASYGAFSQAYDLQIRGLPAESVVYAAANSQCFRGAGAVALPPIYTAPACTPVPAPVPPPPAIAEPAASVRNRFFTLSGFSGQTAKNSLVIGAVDSGSPSAPGNFAKMTTFSSWGPTLDGRIKPDLVAAGSENGVQDCFLGGAETDPRINSTVCTTVVGADMCTSVVGSIYGMKRGTSMAAPAVTGGIGLVLQQQAVTGLDPGDVPLDSDSIKALLIHTATDLQVHFPVGGAFMSVVAPCPGGGAGTECWPTPAVAPVPAVQDGPDYVNGWGLVNISAAASKVITGNPALTLQPSGCPAGVAYGQLPFNSPLAIGGNPATLGLIGCPAAIWDWVGYITVPAGTTQLRVTIAWDDVASVPPPAAATAPLLVHNLDLIVTPGTGMGGAFTPTGLNYYSWRLDPGCPHLQAVRPMVPVASAIYADNRNNVEQVIVDSPAAGGWRIVVQAAGLALPPQQFGIVISMPPTVP